MSCTPNGSTAPAFLTHFQSVEDPRQQGKVLYPLEEIFLLVLCGVISGQTVGRLSQLVKS